jgi:hypothetical protein
MLQVIYPPNKPINALNIEKMLELADEYQIIELNKRCRQFLMQQRGIYSFIKFLLQLNFKQTFQIQRKH